MKQRHELRPKNLVPTWVPDSGDRPKPEEPQPVVFRPDETNNRKDGQGHTAAAMRKESGGERGSMLGETKSEVPLRERQAAEAEQNANSTTKFLTGSGDVE